MSPSKTTTPLTVGYIGLGNAGYPMAANLPKAGFHLVVRDADPSRAARFAKEQPNSRVAADGPSAFADVDVLITMLPNGKVVRDVLLGEGGVARGLKPGAVVVDTSSSSPFDTRALGKDMKELGVDLVDSPITQTHLGAIDFAGATLMIGADEEGAVEKAMPVLKAMSKYQFVMGKLGAGHLTKTLNNYTSVGSIIALCDSLVVGQKLGLDPQTLVDVFNVGTARNFSTAYSMRDEALPRSYASGYQLALLVKDVKIAREQIEAAGLDSELPRLSQKYLEDALAMVKPDADHTECLKSWEKRAGVELKTSPKPKVRVAEEIWNPMGI